MDNARPLPGLSATRSPNGRHHMTPVPMRNVCMSPLVWPRDRFCPRLLCSAVCQRQTHKPEAGRGDAGRGHLGPPLVTKMPHLRPRKWGLLVTTHRSMACNTQGFVCAHAPPAPRHQTRQNAADSSSVLGARILCSSLYFSAFSSCHSTKLNTK